MAMPKQPPRGPAVAHYGATAAFATRATARPGHTCMQGNLLRRSGRPASSRESKQPQLERSPGSSFAPEPSRSEQARGRCPAKHCLAMRTSTHRRRRFGDRRPRSCGKSTRERRMHRPLRLRGSVRPNRNNRCTFEVRSRRRSRALAQVPQSAKPRLRPRHRPPRPRSTCSRGRTRPQCMPRADPRSRARSSNPGSRAESAASSARAQGSMTRSSFAPSLAHADKLPFMR
jgi:hypothetical protein